ncbi:MAG: hypothetical protein QOK43_1360 [Acidimicrobiaceae bacterium]|nr:hypothetical protein [Acidimicrobiaceae bacterium]
MRVLPTRVVRLLRTAGALGLFGGATLAVVTGATPLAHAATQVSVTGGYYWADQPAPLPPPVGQPLGNLSNPTVPAGDWGVGARNDESNMETYLHVNLSTLPLPGTASGFVLHLAEDAGSAGSATALIDAVAVPEYFGDDAVARPYGEQPTVPEGATKVRGQRSTTGEWTWDVTAFVSDCLQSERPDCGMALLPAGGTFQVNFVGPTAPDDPTGTRHPPFAIGEAMASSTNDTTDTTAAVVEDTTPPPDTSSGGSSTNDVVPINDTPPAPDVVTPIDTPIPPPSTPFVARPAPKRVAVQRKEHGAPPFAFFLAVLGALVFFGSGMFALGEDGEPGLPRTGSVFKTLDQRLAAARRQSSKE